MYGMVNTTYVYYRKLDCNLLTFAMAWARAMADALRERRGRQSEEAILLDAWFAEVVAHRHGRAPVVRREAPNSAPVDNV